LRPALACGAVAAANRLSLENSINVKDKMRPGAGQNSNNLFDNINIVTS
jgi:hypothetical protein